MKRFVVLQDENLIMAELQRLSRAEFDMPPAMPAAMGEPFPRRPFARPDGVNGTASMPPTAAVNGETELDENGEVDPSACIDLQALVKTAALRVERDAIEQALARFRWNRRKAAAYLRVSYKTLLNKMKECGITDVEAAES